MIIDYGQGKGQVGRVSEVPKSNEQYKKIIDRNDHEILVAQLPSLRGTPIRKTA